MIQRALSTCAGIVWFRSGVIPPAGTYEGYWTDAYSLFFIEILAMQFAELKRWQDFKNPGSQAKQYFIGLERVFGGSGNPAYPGGQFFNLFNMGATEAEMKKLKTNEIKNGRLAMLAVFGYGAQVRVGAGCELRKSIAVDSVHVHLNMGVPYLAANVR